MKTPLSGGHLSAFYDILGFLSQLHEADDERVWSRVLEKLAISLDAEAATYFLYFHRERRLISRYSLGVASDQLMKVPIETGTGVCGWVAKHREAIIIEDAYKDSRFMGKVDEVTGFITKNILAVPLMDRLDLMGVIELLNKRGDRCFDGGDMRFVEAVCHLTLMTLRALRFESMVNKVSSYHASVLQNLGGGFMAIDLQGRTILLNPSARKILALSPELPLNLPVDQVLSHIPEMAEVLLKTVGNRQTVKRQELHWTHSGTDHILGYSTLLLQDPEGNLSGAGVTFQDITKFSK